MANPVFSPVSRFPAQHWTPPSSTFWTGPHPNNAGSASLLSVAKILPLLWWPTVGLHLLRAFALSFRVLIHRSTLSFLWTPKVFTIQLQRYMNAMTTACAPPLPDSETHLVPRKFASCAGFPVRKIWPTVSSKATLSYSAC
jgi:hypothetical protein